MRIDKAEPPRRKTRAWKPPVIYRRMASVRKTLIARQGKIKTYQRRCKNATISYYDVHLKSKFFDYEGVRRYVIGGFHARLSAGFRSKLVSVYWLNSWKAAELGTFFEESRWLEIKIRKQLKGIGYEF